MKIEQTKYQKLLIQAIYFAGNKTKLSKELGVSRTTIFNWLSGATNPPCAKLLELKLENVVTGNSFKVLAKTKVQKVAHIF